MTATDDVTLYDSLDGQVALVTGANRGLGAEIATRLADLGATVYGGVRSTNREVPDGVESVTLDVTAEGDVQAAVNRIGDEAGRLDIVVNNAGVMDEEGPLHETGSIHIDRVFATNIRGATLVAKHTVQPLLSQEGGRLVNMSSRMAQLTEEQSGGSPAYRISKTALNGLTAYLHSEYGDEGLLANSVSPGWVETDMGGPEAPRSIDEGVETPVWLARHEPGSPAGKFWVDKEVIDW